ncbi:MAG: DUF1801 domain-containing protein [Armatimonadetes bacterium]|nr:DUF1801 domain-containing protein [Armatimonadota bacterium]
MSDIVADVFEAKFPERLEDLRALHATIVAHMPRQLEVSASGGMINYVVPFSVYPKGYHCSKNTRLSAISLAANKGGFSLHMFCMYVDGQDSTWLSDELAKRGIKLDMGKACIRFKKLDQMPLDVLGALLERIDLPKFIELYDSMRPENRKAAKA